MLFIKFFNRLRFFLDHKFQHFIKKKIFPTFAKYGFSSVLKTKRFTVNQNSQTEIHSLVCHKDVYCYLYCIKSLLIYLHNCSVIVHDDGSLTYKDKLHLKKHIKGIIIYESIQANRLVLPKLQKYPLLKKLRGQYVLLKKLTDFSLLSKTGKIIALDSDILFFNRPEELIQWSESNKKEALLSDESPVISYQDRFLPNTSFKYVRSLNSGLICYYANMLDLDLAEKVFALPQFNNTSFRYNNVDDQQFMAVNFGEAKSQKNLSVIRLSPFLYVHNRQLQRKDVKAKHYWFAKYSLKSLLIYLRDKKIVHKSIQSELNH